MIDFTIRNEGELITGTGAGTGTGTDGCRACRPAGPFGQHSPRPGTFFHPPPPHTHTDITIDFINPDCHLLGKKYLASIKQNRRKIRVPRGSKGFIIDIINCRALHGGVGIRACHQEFRLAEIS